MKIWNFAHDTLGMHVYVLLMIFIAIVMVVIGIVHSIKQKKRNEKFEDELKKED